jgi:hypothetical protein
LECTNRQKQQPIHTLIQYRSNKDDDLFIQLLDSGIDLECEDMHKLQPIHYAIQYLSTPLIIGLDPHWKINFLILQRKINSSITKKLILYMHMYNINH